MSCLCSLLACSSHLASRCLVPSCLFVEHVRLVSSARPVCSRYACLLAPPSSPLFVSPGGASSRLALISSCVSPTASACLPTVLRPARPRGAATDVLALLAVMVRLRMPSPRSCVPFFVSVDGEMSGNLIVDEDIFFLVGFLRGLVLFLACVCYNVCRGDGDLRMGGIRASVSYATPPYWGRRVFLLLSTRRPRSCSILVVPLFLIAPPFYTIGGAISFCLLIITLCPSRACLPRLGFADRFGATAA